MNVATIGASPPRMELGKRLGSLVRPWQRTLAFIVLCVLCGALLELAVEPAGAGGCPAPAAEGGGPRRERGQLRAFRA